MAILMLLSLKVIDLKKVIDHDWIVEAVESASKLIKDTYSNLDDVVFVSMLNGSLPFEKEFKATFDKPIHVMRISYHSYNGGTTSTGKISIDVPIKEQKVKDKICIIIEDIVDTGFTMSNVICDLKKAGAKDVKIITMLDKSSKHNEYPIIFSGFTIPDKFVIGYGMDFESQFRELPNIYAEGADPEKDFVINYINYGN